MRNAYPSDLNSERTTAILQLMEDCIGEQSMMQENNGLFDGALTWELLAMFSILFDSCAQVLSVAQDLVDARNALGKVANILEGAPNTHDVVRTFRLASSDHTYMKDEQCLGLCRSAADKWFTDSDRLIEEARTIKLKAPDAQP